MRVSLRFYTYHVLLFFPTDFWFIDPLGFMKHCFFSLALLRKPPLSVKTKYNQIGEYDPTLQQGLGRERFFPTGKY